MLDPAFGGKSTTRIQHSNAVSSIQMLDPPFECWIHRPQMRYRGFKCGSSIQKRDWKIWVVDDFSEHSVNGATHVREKITLGGIDECVALAKAWASLVSPDGRVECPLPSGEILQGVLHPGWGEDGFKKIVGRTWDLKAAYKQLAVVTAHRYANVIVVFNPETGEPSYFVGAALPVGAKASVNGFCRAAMALRQLAVKLLHLAGTNYFDDFPIVEPLTLKDSATMAFTKLCGILGWELSLDDKKNVDFDTVFGPLGVIINFAAIGDGFITVSNKPSRMKEIGAMSAGFVERNALRPGEAATLRGKLLYAEQQCLGRCGAMATRALGHRAQGAAGVQHLDPHLRQALQWIVNFSNDLMPRLIKLRDERPPVLVFTDGACETGEDRVTSCGGIIYEPGQQTETFGFRIPNDIADSWSSGSSKQVIGQAELYPVLVAKKCWAPRLAGRRVIFFIDNDSARFALIRMFSPVSASRDILWQVAHVDMMSRAASWYARVASASNPADGPSCLDFALVTQRWGAIRVYLELPDLSSSIRPE